MSWFRGIDRQFAEIYRSLDDLHRKVDIIMATLDEVLADVTAETSQLDSISTLFSGLQQQLKDALAGTTLPPAVQTKVDAIFTAAEANKAKIVAAINANTPISTA